MKKVWFIVSCIICFWGFTSAYENQGFTNYQEIDWDIKFECNSQCFALIWDSKLWNYIDIAWSVEWNGIVWYWFLQGQQIIPWWTIQIAQATNLDQKFTFSDSPYRAQFQKDSDVQIMFVVQWNIKWQIRVNLWEIWPIDSIKNWFIWSMRYLPYNPRTINFLEWPMRNGKYINQWFVKIILVLLLLVLLWYLFSYKQKDKKNYINMWIWVLVFFWVFFDIFSTVNQFKQYKTTIDATNIMDNGRLWRDTDFYPFLDFIKSQVPNWERWYFISPYPFSFEWTYHIYPDVKFGKITDVRYLFFYNPYWLNNWMGFIDPVYSWGILERDDMNFTIDKEIVWKPYAKIYILKK